jgi:uncharacterized protein (AIM24 family)
VMWLYNIPTTLMVMLCSVGFVLITWLGLIFIRPFLRVFLRSQVGLNGGFHIVNLAGESWILENGAYWASEDSLAISVHREHMMSSFWAGEGFIDWQTKLSGCGRMVVCTQGPVEDIALTPGQKLIANGKYVLGRTSEVSYRIQRPARTLMGTYMSGEGYCRTFEGPGRVLLCSTPYWRYRMFTQQSVQPQQLAAIE